MGLLDLAAIGHAGRQAQVVITERELGGKGDRDGRTAGARLTGDAVPLAVFLGDLHFPVGHAAAVSPGAGRDHAQFPGCPLLNDAHGGKDASVRTVPHFLQ